MSENRAIFDAVAKPSKAELDAAVKAYMKKLALRGGRARAASMTPEERSALAKKAIAARWAKVRAATKKK